MMQAVSIVQAGLVVACALGALLAGGAVLTGAALLIDANWSKWSAEDMRAALDAKTDGESGQDARLRDLLTQVAESNPERRA